MRQNRIVIGLTGSIATGKSTVSARLSGLGYPVVDADRISRELTKPGREGFQKIIEIFGQQYCSSTGELDRVRFAKMIFQNEREREMLNNMMHPLVFREIRSEICFCQEKMVFVDVPLLFEVLDKMRAFNITFDETVLVYIPEDLQLKRLMARDHVDKDDALPKIRSQWSVEEKRKYATYIIDNSRDLASLYYHVDEMLMYFEKKYFSENME